MVPVAESDAEAAPRLVDASGDGRSVGGPGVTAVPGGQDARGARSTGGEPGLLSPRSPMSCQVLPSRVRITGKRPLIESAMVMALFGPQKAKQS